jgi:hypothetical protein
MVYQVLIADDCRMIRQMFGEMLKSGWLAINDIDDA